MSAGYETAGDLLPQAVEPRLEGRFGRPYVFLGRTASTQADLPEDAPEGAVVAADEQTAGRGRLGRRWVAAPGTSLLFSMALAPRRPPSHWPELTLLAAHAVADGVRGVTGLPATVKDPNDVLVHGRKVAGILGEAREGRVVLGIGVNANVDADALPRETVTPASSLLLEAGERVDRAELLARILIELERRYDAWSAQA